MLSLSSPPGQSYNKAHYFCDYIELLALTSNCDDVSLSDIIDRFYDHNSDDFDQGGPTCSEKHDSWESRVIDWFILLESRAQEFGDSYPFKTDSRNFIALNENLNPKQRLYLFLLLCSNWGRIEAGNRHKLASDFEEISIKAFSNYLPDFSQCHKFGKSASKNDRYNGGIRNKVEKFAGDIGRQNDIEDGFFDKKDSGDYGLDLVAWIPLPGDKNLKNIQIFLGQCATGKDWLKKQNEPEKIKNAIPSISNATTMLFIPYDCRNADRSFNEKANITTHLIFDRFRLISLLEGSMDSLTNLSSDQLVSDSIEYEEDLV